MAFLKVEEQEPPEIRRLNFPGNCLLWGLRTVVIGTNSKMPDRAVNFPCHA